MLWMRDKESGRNLSWWKCLGQVWGVKQGPYEFKPTSSSTVSGSMLEPSSSLMFSPKKAGSKLVATMWSSPHYHLNAFFFPSMCVEAKSYASHFILFWWACLCEIVYVQIKRSFCSWPPALVLFSCGSLSSRKGYLLCTHLNLHFLLFHGSSFNWLPSWIPKDVFHAIQQFVAISFWRMCFFVIKIAIFYYPPSIQVHEWSERTFCGSFLCHKW